MVPQYLGCFNCVAVRAFFIFSGALTKFLRKLFKGVNIYFGSQLQFMAT
jgi:hypothetical protein